jgi:hypothetical protein
MPTDGPGRFPQSQASRRRNRRSRPHGSACNPVGVPTRAKGSNPPGGTRGIGISCIPSELRKCSLAGVPIGYTDRGPGAPSRRGAGAVRNPVPARIPQGQPTGSASPVRGHTDKDQASEAASRPPHRSTSLVTTTREAPNGDSARSESSIEADAVAHVLSTLRL